MSEADVIARSDGPRTVRHPQSSFAAWGREADAVTSEHRLEYSLGETSPLARLYERDALVLLLGADYGSCTSFHLAEYRTGKALAARLGAPIMKNGKRTWTWFDDIDLRDGQGPALLPAGSGRLRGRVAKQPRPLNRGGTRPDPHPTQ